MGTVSLQRDFQSHQLRENDVVLLQMMYVQLLFMMLMIIVLASYVCVSRRIRTDDYKEDDDDDNDNDNDDDDDDEDDVLAFYIGSRQI